jgi:hypothetical protein
MRIFMNYLRRRLNRPVIEELNRLHYDAMWACARERAWDGVPAPLVARLRTLEEVLGIVESDRR